MTAQGLNNWRSKHLSSIQTKKKNSSIVKTTEMAGEGKGRNIRQQLLLEFKAKDQ